MEQDFHLASCILVLGASRFLPLGSCFLKNLVSWLLYLASTFFNWSKKTYIQPERGYSTVKNTPLVLGSL